MEIHKEIDRNTFWDYDSLMNLQKLLSELIEYESMTEKEAAELIGTTQATVNRIKNGHVDPSFSIGMKICQLHNQHVSNANND